jgi:uncharacterized SAM-binding protein YcdF (DUF218 family)
MKSRFRRLVFLLCAGAIVTIGALLLPAVGFFLVVADPLVPSDAIFVIDGSTPGRELGAAGLYHQHMAPIVVLTWSREPTGDLPRQIAGEASRQDVAARVLRHVRVPERAIVRQTTLVDNTEQELRADVRFARSRGFRRVILVTSPPHTRRVRTVWRAEARGRVDALVYPTPWEPFSPERWWRSRYNLEASTHELFGLLNFALGTPLGTFDAGD